MTTAQPTANSSVPRQQSASSNCPTEVISPFVQISAPVTTTDLEGNGNGDLAPILTTNPPSVLKQTSLSTTPVSKPVPADYQLPVLETLSPPNHKSAARLQFFVPNWRQITQDSWTLQTIQGYKIPFSAAPGSGVRG